MMGQYDVIVIGAGISGAVIAERYASRDKKVLVIEKRNHIGGNCFDYYNEDGILVSKYGAHIFHTNFEDVWKYVNQFSEFNSYVHRVLTVVEKKLVPVPVNITTVNSIFGLSIQNELEMDAWLARNQVQCTNPKNSKEAAISRVGTILYKKMFENYTKKQWNKFPEEMDASVLSRIPVRNNFDDRYFTDKYQALPVGGYTKFFQKILSHPNIHIMLNTDYFDVRNMLPLHSKLFYTGPIDQFFDFKCHMDHLEYRSIRFNFETYQQEFFQKNSVINYPELDVPYTRIVEFKHFTKQIHPKTTICKEISINGNGKNEKYYPVPTQRNHAIFEKYKEETNYLNNIYFVGRLANYKYFNMDQAFKHALDLFYKIEEDEPYLVN